MGLSDALKRIFFSLMKGCLGKKELGDRGMRGCFSLVSPRLSW